MTRAVLTALLSHWRHHPLQFATLIIGLALATALWSAVQAINAEARSSYAEAAGALGQAPLEELRAEGGSIPVETYVALRRAGWLVTPVLEGDLPIAGHDIRLLGIEPLTAPPRADLPVLEEGADPLAFLTPPGLFFAAPETRALLMPTNPPWRIEARAGIAEGTLLGDIGLVARILGREGQISYLQLLPDQPLDRVPLAEITPNLHLVTPQSGSDLARLTDSFHLNLTAFGVLSFAVGLFIVHAAIGLSFEQRRGVFRTLRAIGVPIRRLVLLMSAELFLLALGAGAIGVVLGYQVAALLLPDVAATLAGLYGAEVTDALSLRPIWALAGLAMALGGTGIAAAGALYRLAKLPPLSAAKPRAWARASAGTTRLQVLAAAALWAITALALIFGSGLLAGFAALAALLLGAALTLPLLTGICLRWGGRHARSVEGEWFWADTGQQLPGLSLALMALLLALATSIGVTTMVSSFRQTFTGYLDQRLASELYVTARDRAESKVLQAFLGPRTEAVLPIWSVPTTIAGRPADMFGITLHDTYRDNWPLLAALPDVWDRIERGEGVLINEQLGYRGPFAPGDQVTLAPDWQLPVLGIYSDYGNPEGQIIMANATLAARYPDRPRLRFGLRLDPGDVPELKAALQSELGLPPSALTDQAAIKAFSLGVFERTFTVTGALSLLTLGVAAFALLTSLLTLSALRIPQLAPVWALGLTRRRLARLEMARTLMLAGLTFLFAIPVGLALAWVLLNVVNVEAFGWRLPMFLYPLRYAGIGALALLTAALAAAIPVRRLARLPAADLLRVFANAR